MIVADLAEIAGRHYPARRKTQNLVGGASPIQATNFCLGHVTLEPNGGQVPWHNQDQEEIYFIVEGTLRDLRAQAVIERAITRLLGAGRRLPLTPKRLSMTGGKHPFRFRSYRMRRLLLFWRPRHGLIGQVMITVILCFVAAWANVESSKPAAPNHQPTANEGATSRSAGGK